MQFSFKNLNKEPLLIAMPDGSNLTILPPKNKDIKKIQALETETDLYAALETILNLNANGKRYTYEQITADFDVVDVIELTKTFGEYIRKLTNQKN